MKSHYTPKLIFEIDFKTKILSMCVACLNVGISLRKQKAFNGALKIIKKTLHTDLSILLYRTVLCLIVSFGENSALLWILIISRNRCLNLSSSGHVNLQYHSQSVV